MTISSSSSYILGPISCTVIVPFSKEGRAYTFKNTILLLLTLFNAVGLGEVLARTEREEVGGGVGVGVGEGMDAGGMGLIVAFYNAQSTARLLSGETTSHQITCNMSESLVRFHVSLCLNDEEDEKNEDNNDDDDDCNLLSADISMLQ